MFRILSQYHENIRNNQRDSCGMNTTTKRTFLGCKCLGETSVYNTLGFSVEKEADLFPLRGVMHASEIAVPEI
eukprot:1579157-Amphidinium_carterae.1